MPQTTAASEELTSTLSAQDVAAYHADILSRLKTVSWYIEEIMKRYPTEPMGSALDRICRAQTLLAEIAKDLAIVALEEATNTPSSPVHN
jgi:hypothetical protein